MGWGGKRLIEMGPFSQKAIRIDRSTAIAVPIIAGPKIFMREFLSPRRVAFIFDKRSRLTAQSLLWVSGFVLKTRISV